MVNPLLCMFPNSIKFVYLKQKLCGRLLYGLKMKVFENSCLMQTISLEQGQGFEESEVNLQNVRETDMTMHHVT